MATCEFSCAGGSGFGGSTNHLLVMDVAQGPSHVQRQAQLLGQFKGGRADQLPQGLPLNVLKEVQVLTERWLWQYNHVRPHQSLGYRPPAPEARDWPLAASREGSQPAIH